MGKKDRLINDNSIIEKQKLQLEELAEKQEQLKMMIKWRESLCNIKNQELESLVKVWKKLAPGYTPNENGKNKIKKLLREYSYVQVSEAMEIAAQRYLKFEESGDVTNESWNNAFNKIKGICYYSSMPKDKQIIYAKRGFIIGILNKKFNINFYDDIEIKRVIDEQIKQGNNLEDIEYLAKGCYSKSDFLENLREI